MSLVGTCSYLLPGNHDETHLALQLVANRYLDEGRKLPRYFTKARCAELGDSDQPIIQSSNHPIMT
eukprot:902617-Amphidinium_carterae.1